MVPEGGLAPLRPFDAIYLGAVGFPGVPDHVSLWGMLIPIRREFDQYVNLRPVRLMPGVTSPLRDGKPTYWVGRENTGGECSQVGGRVGEGENEMVLQVAAFT